MSSRLTLEELRKAEAIYTESSDNYHWENARITLYRRHGSLGSVMLPAFIIALNQLEEAQRLLDPTGLLYEAAGMHGMKHFSMESYDGKSFIDPDAPKQEELK